MKIKIPLFLSYFLTFYASAELVPELSSQLNDYNLNISSRYNTAVFARSNPDFTGSRIWQVKLASDNRFETPQMLSFGPEQYRYSDPMLSADGHTLFFISDRPLTPDDKSEDYNIWQASWVEGEWQNIHPLAVEINSDTDELGPELHNGILYFSSARNGKLSLYQADTTKSTVVVTPYKEIVHPTFQQSDLTFSPDGSIAVFWQLTEDQKDTVLMMQRRASTGWESPIIMPAQVQSSAYEFTPQFSPDGQWLYITSGRPAEGYEQLNIHRFATKEIFPPSWYKEHLGKVDMPVLADKKRMASIKSFEYDLEIIRGETQTREHVRLEFDPFQLRKTQGDQVSWSDGNQGYRQNASGEKTALAESEAKQLVQSARYNFIYMFKEGKTELFRQYAAKNETGQLYRVHSEGLSPFTILVDHSGKTIEQLRYDDLAVGLEQDYQQIEGVHWPMKFEFIVNQSVIAKGTFSNVKIDDSEIR